MLHGATNTFGFLTPGLATATRWWLIAGVYALAALLVSLAYGIQLQRKRSGASRDVSLPVSAPPD